MGTAESKAQREADEAVTAQDTLKGTLLQESCLQTSLVVQWLGVLLPMQGTQVRALVREYPTCHGATKPVCHNY